MTRQALSNNPGRSKVRVVTMLWWLSGFLSLAAFASVFAGFFGWWWPLADSLSLLRMPLGLACLCAALLPFKRLARVGLLSAGLAAGLTTLPYFLGGRSGGDVTVYAKNMWYRNDALPELAADILDSGAEVVLLQELSQRNDAILNLLGERFPYQHICDGSAWRNVAVLSVRPMTDSACSTRRSVAAAQVDGTFWAVSVHLPWPYPYRNAGVAQDGAALIAQLDGPVVMGGDFNIFPWASSVQRLKRAGGMRAAGPLRPTYDLAGVPLFLDHVWAPGGGKVTYRPGLGSDHRGVLARIHLDP